MAKKKNSEAYLKNVSLIYRDQFDDFEAMNQSLDLLKEIDTDGHTILTIASIQNKDRFVKNLLEKGSEVNHQDKLGWTPLHYAVQNNSLEVTEVLLNFGADPNIQDSYGNSALVRSVFCSPKGDTTLIKLLINKGADPNLKNYTNISAEDLAIKIGDEVIKEYFSSLKL